MTEKKAPAKAPAKKAPAKAESKKPAGTFDALPQDPNHPLYSPLTVDGNK